MRVKVTQKGVFDKDGNRVKVGKVLDIKADKMPSHLVGKSVDLDALQAEPEVEEVKQPTNSAAQKA